MRPASFLFVLSLCLSACGSTIVVDGGSGEQIPTDVTSDAPSDVPTAPADTAVADTAAADTAAADTAMGDLDPTPDTSPPDTGGPTPCDTAGCACDGPDGCAEALVCADGLCCAPACGAKVCGDNGCGGSCGECDGEWGCNQYGACMICEPGVSVCIGNSTMTCNADGDGYSGVPFECADIAATPICEDGACVCAPDCDGKVCGDDGCGGSCGACEAAGDVCSEGACVCGPQCEDLECGDDGCGGSCGECNPGVCNNGFCESPVFALGDACENPYEIAKLPFNLWQDSTVLANNNEEQECLGFGPELTVGGGRDLVYSLVITQDGTLNVGFSTWDGVGMPDWPMIVYLKTSCKGLCSEYIQAAIPQASTFLDMPVQQGQTIFIVVDGVSWGDEGTYNLNVQLNP